MWGQLIAGIMANQGGKSTGNPGRAAQDLGGQMVGMDRGQQQIDDVDQPRQKKNIYAMPNLDREKRQILDNIAKRFGGGQR